MRRRMPAASIAAFACVVMVRAAVPAAGPAAAQGATLPAGPGRDVVLRLCDECHSVQTATARRRLPREWRSVMDRMYTKGLSATPKEADQVLAYFTRHFGKVDVNRDAAPAIAAVLEISSTTATAVIKARPHASVDDLARVPGLTDRKIAAIRDRVVF